MKKLIADFYSKKITRKSRIEFATGQLFMQCFFWFALLAGLFFLLKFFYDWFHLK